MTAESRRHTMESNTNGEKTALSLKSMKENGEKITMITAYDYSSATLAQKAGIDTILVGDSLQMVMLEGQFDDRCDDRRHDSPHQSGYRRRAGYFCRDRYAFRLLFFRGDCHQARYENHEGRPVRRGEDRRRCQHGADHQGGGRCGDSCRRTYRPDAADSHLSWADSKCRGKGEAAGEVLADTGSSGSRRFYDRTGMCSCGTFRTDQPEA